jgi:hypothetical protein
VTATVPERMTAAVLRGPGRLSVEEVPVPALGAGDVLVAIDLCGVCGTDLHMVVDGWGEPGRPSATASAAGPWGMRSWAARPSAAAAVPPAGPAGRRCA